MVYSVTEKVLDGLLKRNNIPEPVAQVAERVVGETQALLKPTNIEHIRGCIAVVNYLVNKTNGDELQSAIATTYENNLGRKEQREGDFLNRVRPPGTAPSSKERN